MERELLKIEKKEITEISEARRKYRQRHLAVDELSGELLNYCEKEFNISRKVLFSLEDDEEKRQEIIDYLFEIECDGIEVGGFVTERGNNAADIVTAICYFPIYYPHICPVCGKHEFPNVDSCCDCEICGWTDDVAQEAEPNLEEGKNTMSLNQAKAEWTKKEKGI